MPESPTTRRWRALVEAHAVSGMTSREFAQQMDVNPRTLTWWRSRLRHSQPAADQPRQLPAPKTVFTEVTVAEEERSVLLALDTFRAHVIVRPETDLAMLRRLLEVVA